MIHPTGILLTAAFSLLSVLTIQAANAQKYKAIFLGTFGGDQTIAYAINDLDDVVGFSQLPGNTGQEHAFLYRNGKLIDLDSIDFGSEARGINHYGQIIGDVFGSNGDYPFLDQHSNLKYLPSLSGPNGGNIAFGINDLGDTVGISWNASYWAGFLYHNGKMTQIGIGYPLAINNIGQIVGASGLGGHPALYQNGSLVDLGSLGGSGGYAYAINNVGQIVGYSYTANAMHAFIYKNGAMKDLDPTSIWASSWAFGINDNGEVVGQATDANRIPFAFLYTQKTGIVNLNDYVVNLAKGTSIGFTSVANGFAVNRNGDIAGLGSYFTGSKTIQAGFLLKRISN